MSTFNSAIRQFLQTAALACLLLVTSVPLSAQQLVVETITINNRAPDSVRQAILPQLLPGARIGQIGEHLVIATSRQNMDELRREIERLDVAPQRMQISVDFSYGQDNNDSWIETRTVDEEEMVIFHHDDGAETSSPDSDDVPPGRVYLALRVAQQGDRIQLLYGYSDNSDVVADSLVLLEPGQWHVVDDSTTRSGDGLQPQSPVDFLLQAAPDSGQSRRMAIRVMPAA